MEFQFERGVEVQLAPRSDPRPSDGLGADVNPPEASREQLPQPVVEVRRPAARRKPQRVAGSTPDQESKLALEGQLDVTHTRVRSSFVSRRAGPTVGSRAELGAELDTQLGAQLRAIWAEERWSLADKRERLFQRWDECEEAAGDDAVRDQIKAFIQGHAPRASESGYTDAELEDMNRRRVSAELFSPYA
jgi:hypothetical protein